MGRTIMSRKDLKIKWADPKEQKELHINLESRILEDYEKPKFPEEPANDVKRKKLSFPPIKTSLFEDNYTSRLLKYIPAEVIALYITLDAIIRSAEDISILIYWFVFLFGMIGTYLYLWRVAKVSKKIQLLISVGAFVVWVFAIGGPFTTLSWYEPIYGGLLLPMYTFVTAIIEA